MYQEVIKHNIIPLECGFAKGGVTTLPALIELI
jgi:hypothetical protein